MSRYAPQELGYLRHALSHMDASGACMVVFFGDSCPKRLLHSVGEEC